MRKIDRLLSEYGESHQHATNKLIHWVCVPLIFLSIVGLIWSIPSDGLRYVLGSRPMVNWATMALVVVVIYYLTLSFSLAVGMAMFAWLCLRVIYVVEYYWSIEVWLFSIIVFVAAWIGQFYGHKVEGKKPSFLKDVQFLLIGPAWLLHFIYKKLGLRY